MVLVVVLGAAAVAGFAAVLLRRRRRARPAEAVAAPRFSVVTAARRSSVVGRSARAMGRAHAGLEHAAMVCPTCHTEYAGHAYCLRDARRLILAQEFMDSAIGTGVVCVSCRRAFEAGLRQCPHDGGDLVPATTQWSARTRHPGKTQPTGVIARVCPVCRGQYDLAARFCGVDGATLHVIN
jgi:hypothetical protein